MMSARARCSSSGSALALVYYPLWVARYHYRHRSYQVVVDGYNGRVLYGKAPGNTLYRALMLVAGTAPGHLLVRQWHGPGSVSGRANPATAIRYSSRWCRCWPGSGW